MATKFYKDEKFQKVFYPILYFLLLAAFVCSGCYAFSNLYYEKIYISGPSMNPTLIGESSSGGKSHYGKADKSRRVIDRLSRFDVVITYFPHTWSSEEEVYKVKRVWGFPGETISMTSVQIDPDTEGLKFTASVNDEVIAEYTAPIKKNIPVTIDTKESTWDLAYFNNGIKTFKVRTDLQKRVFEKTLQKDEYFIMGDHWGNSADSYLYTVGQGKDTSTYITNSLLQGRVVQIEGIANVENGKIYNKQKIQGMFEF